MIIIRVFFRTSKAASRFSNNCESASKRIFGFSILNFWLFKFSILNFRLSVFRAVSPTGQNSPQHVTVRSGIFFSVPSCSGFSLYLQTRGLQTENLQVAYAYREVGEGKRMQEETGRRPEAGGRDRFRQNSHGPVHTTNDILYPRKQSFRRQPAVLFIRIKYEYSIF